MAGGRHNNSMVSSPARLVPEQSPGQVLEATSGTWRCAWRAHNAEYFFVETACQGADLVPTRLKYARG
jgi:hypothetical protein